MKISQVLKETKVPQITGRLIRFNDITDEFVGKCALGVLACESGDPNLKLNKDKIGVDYGDIIKAYGIEDERIYPLPHSPNIVSPEKTWDYSMSVNLATIIMRLNDLHKLTFKQIGEFLEVTFGY